MRRYKRIDVNNWKKKKVYFLLITEKQTFGHRNWTVFPAMHQADHNPVPSAVAVRAAYSISTSLNLFVSEVTCKLKTNQAYAFQQNSYWLWRKFYLRTEGELNSEVKTIPCQFHVFAFTKEAERASQAPYDKECNVCGD